MKFIIAGMMGLLAQPAFSCVNIGGTYLMGSAFYIQHQQKGCETLTELWCGPGGKECGPDSYTWTLDPGRKNGSVWWKSVKLGIYYS